MASPYDRDLDKNPANFQPLTPITFLERSGSVFPDRTAIIHGARRWSYREFYARARADLDITSGPLPELTWKSLQPPPAASVDEPSITRRQSIRYWPPLPAGML